MAKLNRPSLVFLVFAGGLLIVACSTASRIRGPDGTDNYWNIKCGVAVKSACFEEAADKCHDGYTIVESGVGRLLVRCRLPGEAAPPANGQVGPTPTTTTTTDAGVPPP
jgi:hypothetical protein